MSQIVDTESAKEFMKETLEKVSVEDLGNIARDLHLKSEAMRKLLAPERVGQLTQEEARRLLRWVFTTRRRCEQVLESVSLESFRGYIAELLYEERPVQERFQNFFDSLPHLPDYLRIDLGGELLHFAFPESCWLWCRWLWDKKNKTGALPLVVTEDFDFSAPSVGQMYLKVGKATAFVHEVGEAAGYQTISRSLFGTDVFLCSVYVIYTYTVLRMRMTQEFNKVVPGLEEFSRRVLGVYHLEEFQL